MRRFPAWGLLTLHNLPKCLPFRHRKFRQEWMEIDEAARQKLHPLVLHPSECTRLPEWHKTPEESAALEVWAWSHNTDGPPGYSAEKSREPRKWREVRRNTLTSKYTQTQAFLYVNFINYMKLPMIYKYFFLNVHVYIYI